MSDYKIERPVAGEVTRSSRTPSEQISAAEFLARIDAVFAFSEVESIRWQGYTPFFNDGEECVYGIHEVGVRITGIPEDAGDYEDGYLNSWDLRATWRGEDVLALIGSGVDIDGINAALEELDSDDWENVARENFGDHAEVTATRAGFSVEYYEHE